VTAYREAMAGFAGMGTLEIWYASLSEDILMNAARGAAKTKREAKEVKRASKDFEKARTRDSLQALSKLGELVDGARSGDPVAIAAYLGTSDQFDRAVTDFSQRYADQDERDYEALVGAVRSGRLQALEGV
jgi:hypothetical protein